MKIPSLPEVHHYHCIHDDMYAEDLAAQINNNGPYSSFLVERPATPQKQMRMASALSRLLAGEDIRDVLEVHERAPWLPRAFTMVEGNSNARVVCIDGDYDRICLEDYFDETKFSIDSALQLAERDELMAGQALDEVRSAPETDKPVALITGASHTTITSLLRVANLDVKRYYSPDGLEKPIDPQLGRMVKVHFDQYDALKRAFVHGVVDYHEFCEHVDEAVRLSYSDKYAS